MDMLMMRGALMARNADEVHRLCATGADPNALDRLAWSPLHHAAYLGDARSVRELLTAGADPNAQNGDGYTPLHWAAANARCDVVRELVVFGGADVTLRDNQGCTPAEISANQKVRDELSRASRERSRINASVPRRAYWKGYWAFTKLVLRRALASQLVRFVIQVLALVALEAFRVQLRRTLQFVVVLLPLPQLLALFAWAVAPFLTVMSLLLSLLAPALASVAAYLPGALLSALARQLSSLLEASSYLLLEPLRLAWEALPTAAVVTAWNEVRLLSSSLLESAWRTAVDQLQPRAMIANLLHPVALVANRFVDWALPARPARALRRGANRLFGRLGTSYEAALLLLCVLSAVAVALALVFGRAAVIAERMIEPNFTKWPETSPFHEEFVPS
eukprot:m51a1_g3830 hypothetical protein (392) ;mRNA; f:320890-322148